MQCARHPKVETFVRCGKCDQPICPSCMVSGPVGVRCRECGRQNLDAIMRGSPRQYLVAILCAVGSALLLGWLCHVPFFWFWLAAVYGYAVGEATLRGGGRKRGLAMQIIAGVAAAAGAFGWSILPLGRLPLSALLAHSGAVLGLLLNPWSLVGLGIGVVCAVTHVRYL